MGKQVKNFTSGDMTKSSSIFSHDKKSGEELLLNLARLLDDIRDAMVWVIIAWLPWLQPSTVEIKEDEGRT